MRSPKEHARHHAMDPGGCHLTPSAFPEGQVRLVNHHLDHIAAPGTIPEPEAEPQVHCAKSVAVGHPLHEKSPWRDEPIEESIGLGKIRGTERSECWM
jgi:hypothetical protein